MNPKQIRPVRFVQEIKKYLKTRFIGKMAFKYKRAIKKNIAYQKGV